MALRSACAGLNDGLGDFDFLLIRLRRRGPASCFDFLRRRLGLCDGLRGLVRLYPRLRHPNVVGFLDVVRPRDNFVHHTCASLMSGFGLMVCDGKRVRLGDMMHFFLAVGFDCRIVEGRR